MDSNANDVKTPQKVLITINKLYTFKIDVHILGDKQNVTFLYMSETTFLVRKHIGNKIYKI